VCFCVVAKKISVFFFLSDFFTVVESAARRQGWVFDLPGPWENGKTVGKTGKNSRACIAFHHFNIIFILVVASYHRPIQTSTELIMQH